jgi:hypothetical protein
MSKGIVVPMPLRPYWGMVTLSTHAAVQGIHEAQAGMRTVMTLGSFCLSPWFSDEESVNLGCEISGGRNLNNTV